MSKVQNKKCATCKELKATTEFYRHARMRDGLQPYCKICHGVSVRKWQKKNKKKVYATVRRWQKRNPDKIAEYGKKNHYRRKLRKYGLTESTHNAIIKKYNGRCHICKKKQKRMVLDHCHKNGHVRGLLCDKCNMGLGLFCDSAEQLQNAIDYLQQ